MKKYFWFVAICIAIGIAVPVKAAAPEVYEIRVKEVLSGFKVKDFSGKIFRLAGVRAMEFDSSAERAAYDADLKEILSSWLSSGETIYVMHDGRRERTGAIPAFLFVGEGANVSLEYLVRGFAEYDTAVPGWIDFESLLLDVETMQAEREAPEEEPVEPAENVEIEPLTVFIFERGQVVYRGYVYPEQ